MAAQRDRSEGRVVVGVDGSEHGRQALRWALEEAKLRDLSCLVVHAWHYSSVAANPYLGIPIPEVETAARRVLEQELALTKGSGVAVEGQLVEMSAADALIVASDGAEMLVVGCRGRGSLAAALLGSVSTACVRHARCPVVVVRTPQLHTEKLASEAVPEEVGGSVSAALCSGVGSVALADLTRSSPPEELLTTRLRPPSWPER